MGEPVTRTQPAVDDHFVKEGSRVEVVRGILVMAPPAEEPHAALHFSLAYLLGAHVAPGYSGAVDLLTRSGLDSDFAPDASIYPSERDPSTGGRKLEELAFEVADSQPLDAAGEKARELVRRGVRRVFCIVVKHGRVLEWSHETDGWSPLPASASIEDRCLVAPLPVRALVDAASTDAAIIGALVARRSPALLALQASARSEGRSEGAAAALLAVLRARGLEPSESDVAAVRAASSALLERWLARVVSVASVGELLRDRE